MPVGAVQHDSPRGAVIAACVPIQHRGSVAHGGDGLSGRGGAAVAFRDHDGFGNVVGAAVQPDGVAGRHGIDGGLNIVTGRKLDVGSGAAAGAAARTAGTELLLELLLELPLQPLLELLLELLLDPPSQPRSIKKAANKATAGNKKPFFFMGPSFSR